MIDTCRCEECGEVLKSGDLIQALIAPQGSESYWTGAYIVDARFPDSILIVNDTIPRVHKACKEAKDASTKVTG